MAIGNQFLGQSRGAIGDIVTRVVKGEQVISVKPATSQLKKYTLTQRKQQMAFGMASLMWNAYDKFLYQLFEGYVKEERVKSKFFSMVQADIKRRFVADKKIKATVENASSRFRPKGAICWVPTVCRFTYGKQSDVIKWVEESSVYRPVAYRDKETVGQWLGRMMLKAGDIITVFLGVIEGDYDRVEKPYNFVYDVNPRVIQFRVRNLDIIEQERVCEFANFNDILSVITEVGPVRGNWDKQRFWSDWTIETFYNDGRSEPYCGCMAVVCSSLRINSRKKEKWYHTLGVMNLINKEKFGLLWDAAIKTYEGYYEVMKF